MIVKRVKIHSGGSPVEGPLRRLCAHSADRRWHLAPLTGAHDASVLLCQSCRFYRRCGCVPKRMQGHARLPRLQGDHNAGGSVEPFYPYHSYIQHFLIPVAVSSVLYWKSCRALYVADKIAQGSRFYLDRSNVCQQQVARRLAKRRKAVRMMVLCFVLFFSCYAPHALYDILIIV